MIIILTLGGQPRLGNGDIFYRGPALSSSSSRRNGDSASLINNCLPLSESDITDTNLYRAVKC